MAKESLALLRSREIFVGFGIDCDDVALRNEMRHLDDESGLGGGGFQRIRYRRALHSRVRFHHLEIYRLGHRDVERGAVEELNLNLSIGREKSFDLFNHLRGQRGLIKGLGIHKVELVAFPVKEFHLDLVEDYALDPIFGAEPVFSLTAGLDIA